jgi:hypothetical protein
MLIENQVPHGDSVPVIYLQESEPTWKRRVRTKIHPSFASLGISNSKDAKRHCPNIYAAEALYRALCENFASFFWGSLILWWTTNKALANLVPHVFYNDDGSINQKLLDRAKKALKDLGVLKIYGRTKAKWGGKCSTFYVDILDVSTVFGDNPERFNPLEFYYVDEDGHELPTPSSEIGKHPIPELLPEMLEKLGMSEDSFSPTPDLTDPPEVEEPPPPEMDFEAESIETVVEEEPKTPSEKSCLGQPLSQASTGQRLSLDYGQPLSHLIRLINEDKVELDFLKDDLNNYPRSLFPRERNQNATYKHVGKIVYVANQLRNEKVAQEHFETEAYKNAIQKLNREEASYDEHQKRLKTDPAYREMMKDSAPISKPILDPSAEPKIWTKNDKAFVDALRDIVAQVTEHNPLVKIKIQGKWKTPAPGTQRHWSGCHHDVLLGLREAEETKKTTLLRDIEESCIRCGFSLEVREDNNGFLLKPF